MTSKWFVNFNTSADSGTPLFCFPYAGGSAAIFAKWHEILSGQVAVLALQSPGRSSRLMESAIDTMEELSTIVADEMSQLIQGQYAILGHSLGARLAWEVSLKLIDKGLPPPSDFIASGSPAASLKRTQPKVYDLPEAEFIQELRDMGGTPEEVFQHEELKALVFPALRADFKIVDTYQATEGKIDTRAHCFYGTKDHTFPEEHAHCWQNHFVNGCAMHAIDGGHFFIDSHQQVVVELVSNILSR